jgi:DNA-binding NarL/FixJ family response regulator
MLVGDHAGVRAGYRHLLELEGDFEIVGEHADADAAITALTGTGGGGVDVVVLDLAMPRGGGLDMLMQVTSQWPRLRVILSSMYDSPGVVAWALRGGAAGFVTKGSDPTELVRCVRLVTVQTEPVLSQDLARLRSAAERAHDGPPS